MKNDITADPLVTQFVTEDQNMADVILEGYEQGIYDKVFAKLSNDEIRQKLSIHENKTFSTHQNEAFVNIINRELAKRAGHPNEKVAEEIIGRPLHDYEKHLFDTIDHCQKTGKEMIFFKRRGHL